MDWSSFSDQELEQIAGRKSKPTPNSSLIGDILGGYKNYLKGVVTGGVQSLGDKGASIVNFPISGIEKLIGKNIPHVPHPDLLNQPTSGLSESIGRFVGRKSADLAVPGFAGIKTASMLRNAPEIAKILGATSSGALTGAATHEDDRGYGALEGSLAGLLGGGTPSIKNFIHSHSSKGISENVRQRLGSLKQHYGSIFNPLLEEAEKSGANKFLSTQNANIRLLQKAGNGKYLYSLEKFNENPGVRTAHEAQSELGKYRASLPSRKDALELNADKEAKKIQNRLLLNIKEAMTKVEKPELADKYSEARIGYKKDVGPYLDSKAIRNLEEGKLRPKKFKDEILKEEEFLTKVGHHHPELGHVESWRKVSETPLGHGLKHGAGIVVGGLIPYELAKLLGYRH